MESSGKDSKRQRHVSVRQIRHPTRESQRTAAAAAAAEPTPSRSILGARDVTREDDSDKAADTDM